jgi:hypothetical protein
MFVILNCVYLFPITWDRILKKRSLKHQDSNLESFNYESGILPLQPTLLNKYSHIKFILKIAR